MPEQVKRGSSCGLLEPGHKGASALSRRNWFALIPALFGSLRVQKPATTATIGLPENYAAIASKVIDDCRKVGYIALPAGLGDYVPSAFTVPQVLIRTSDGLRLIPVRAGSRSTQDELNVKEEENV